MLNSWRPIVDFVLTVIMFEVIILSWLGVEALILWGIEKYPNKLGKYVRADVIFAIMIAIVVLCVL